MNTHAFTDLTLATRAASCAELQADLASGRAFRSNRLRETSTDRYFELLYEALGEHDDLWLVDQLRLNDCIVRPKYWTKTGKYQTTPSNAETILARGEFKRYYVRGLCMDALARGITTVEFYRAYESLFHRAESDMLIGTTVTADALLSFCREFSADGEPYSGPPCEFGSGLCVQLTSPVTV